MESVKAYSISWRWKPFGAGVYSIFKKDIDPIASNALKSLGLAWDDNIFNFNENQTDEVEQLLQILGYSLFKKLVTLDEYMLILRGAK